MKEQEQNHKASRQSPHGDGPSSVHHTLILVEFFIRCLYGCHLPDKQTAKYHDSEHHGDGEFYNMEEP